MSADANGRDLIVSLQDKDAIRLIRVAVGGGIPQAIPMTGGSFTVPTPDCSCGKLTTKKRWRSC